MSQARLAGIFYLLTIFVGIFAAFAPSKMLGDIGNLIGTAFYLVVTALLYLMLKPVSPSLSLLAGLISVAGCAVGALEALHRSPFSFHGIVIFGFYCLLLGYLIFGSKFFPRWLGPLVALAGLGWLTYLSPTFARHLGFIPMITGIVGEDALTICLLFMSTRHTQPV